MVETPAWVHGSLAGHNLILEDGTLTNERKYQITHLPSGCNACSIYYKSIPDLKAALVRMLPILDWTQDAEGIKRQVKEGDLWSKLREAIYGQ